MAKMKTAIRTTMVVPYTSFRFGQVTLFVSALTSDIKLLIRFSTKAPLLASQSIISRIKRGGSFYPSVFFSCFFSLYTNKKWQARRDSNPHPPDLESGALPIRATGLCPLSILLFNPVIVGILKLFLSDFSLKERLY